MPSNVDLISYYSDKSQGTISNVVGNYYTKEKKYRDTNSTADNSKDDTRAYALLHESANIVIGNYQSKNSTAISSKLYNIFAVAVTSIVQLAQFAATLCSINCAA